MRLDRWIGGLILVFIVVSIIVGFFLLGRGSPKPSEVEEISGLLKPKFYGSSEGIGVVHIYGPIMIEPPISSFSLETRGADFIVETIEDFTEDKRVKALLVRVNSPGGAIAASQEIYEALWRFRQSGRPVVASMGDLAASGGYYISSAANFIMANPGTITGSIGVIFNISNFKELMSKIGMKQEVLKSGEFKDIGSYSRDMTASEKELIQTMIDEFYEQFLEAIARGRDKDIEKIRTLADGRVITGEQALESGLIDGLGSFSEAILKAGEMAGIEGKPKLIEPKRKSFMQILDMLQMGSTKNPLDMLLSRHLPIMYMYHSSALENHGYQMP